MSQVWQSADVLFHREPGTKYLLLQQMWAIRCISCRELRDFHLLSDFNEVRSSIKAAKRVYVFLDYDGTLTPIVSKPESATLSKRVRTILRFVSTLPSCRLAIVSGRSSTIGGHKNNLLLRKPRVRDQWSRSEIRRLNCPEISSEPERYLSKKGEK